MIVTYKKISLKELLNRNNQKQTVVSTKTIGILPYHPSTDRLLLSRASKYKGIDLNSKYQKITIPKKKGGFRHLVNPEPELKQLQKDIALHLYYLGCLPHNNAFAYVKNKDTTLNAKVHKDSKVILALDIKDFFGSITLENLVNRLNEFAIIPYTKDELHTLLYVCCLNGTLPQGSPASPLLSNLYMVVFDNRITTLCSKLGYKYTRYADDMFISGNDIPHPVRLIKTIQEYLDKTSNNTLLLNKEKTKILRPGKCYITGVKINKDNKLSYGHEKKAELKHMIHNLFIKHLNGICTKEEVQETLGLYSYARRIEPEYFSYLEKKFLRKFNSKEISFAKYFKEYL